MYTLVIVYISLRVGVITTIPAFNDLQSCQKAAKAIQYQTGETLKTACIEK